MPRIITSYSAMLLVHQNLSFAIVGYFFPNSNMNSAQIPNPIEFTTPLKNILHLGYDFDMSFPTKECFFIREICSHKFKSLINEDIGEVLTLNCFLSHIHNAEHT